MTTIRRPPMTTRREWLQRSSLGFGTLALAHLLQQDGLLAAPEPGGTDAQPRAGHFAGPARSVIVLLQMGGPSQVDLFDPKPELQKRDGQKHPGEVESFQPGSNDNRLMASPFRFRKHGRCGMELSDRLPYLGGVVDELCMVRSM